MNQDDVLPPRSRGNPRPTSGPKRGGPAGPSPKKRRAIPTYKEALFLCEYFKTGNAKKAYLAANPDATAKQAEGNGPLWLRKSNIAAAVMEAYQMTMDKMDTSVERIVQEIATIAFLDIKDIFDEDGNLLPISEMPEHARRALAGMDVEDIFTGRGEDRETAGNIRKMKLSCKLKALELLGKYREMFVDKTKVEGSITLAELVKDIAPLPEDEDGDGDS